ncbi:MAG: HlyD family efflux transporter periplasmic adaptor subunit [Winogradskyella sp.]|uniref:HlyD family secretion protein n=1 Tax=Winogradskyella sp. TaxID=1883156 RepID=UPI0017EF7E8A|nr:HlyD family efflux transporter periplasmic adaptor subunit [Winogradskyella sp.]MBT8245770.1 HlyD family secretion protein [Winogradskyella sp.]NNK23340.1 HlyD family efflux transporter periplasmic adaptor subunit [Winogradskyella sp.]
MHFSPDPLHNLENLSAKNNTKSISIYLVIVLVLIGILACLPIIKVDISSQSRGILRAAKDNVPINAVLNGRVTYANMVNNQVVSKGDTLLTIIQDNLKAQQQLNDSLLHITQTQYADITNLLNGKTTGFMDPIIQDDFNRYRYQKQELQTRVKQAQQIYNRNNTLFKKQVIAKAEYETHAFNLQLAKDALYSFIKQQKAQWQNQKRDIETQIQNLEGRLNQLTADADNYTVTAPISGTLENVLGLQVGSFVNSLQPLATISPNSNLIVENTVLPSDIGLLKKGQKVQFQLDAFNYNQWGMLEGEVIDIDNNITLQDQAAFFKVRCSLYTKKLELKNGYTAQVKKGMTLTTRYFITTRSLYDLLFDKVDDWLNPKLITQN